MTPSRLDYTAKKAPRRRRRQGVSSPPAPAALTLLEAEFTYVGPGGALRLEFDRAINLDAFDPSQITVNDNAGSGWQYGGTGVVDTPDAQTVVVEMGPTTPGVGFINTVSATGATNIVAVDDGAPWPGVTELGLPYP